MTSTTHALTDTTTDTATSASRRTGAAVAVIGAGPIGLAAAVHLL